MQIRVLALGLSMALAASTSPTLADNPNIDEHWMNVDSSSAEARDGAEVPENNLHTPLPADIRNAGGVSPLIVIDGAPVLTAAQVGSSSFVTTSGSDFRPDSTRDTGAFFYFDGGYWRGSSEFNCLHAPADLPHKAVMNQVFFYGLDNESLDIMTMTLRRKKIFSSGDEGSETIFAVNSSGASSTSTFWSDFSVTDEALRDVDRVYYSYFYTVCMNGASHRLYGAKTYYDAQ